ncbi:unnamed protein product [Arctogadus glacialis]
MTGDVRPNGAVIGPVEQQARSGLVETKDYRNTSLCSVLRSRRHGDEMFLISVADPPWGITHNALTANALLKSTVVSVGIRLASKGFGVWIPMSPV